MHAGLPDTHSVGNGKHCSSDCVLYTYISFYTIYKTVIRCFCLSSCYSFKNTREKLYSFLNYIFKRIIFFFLEVHKRLRVCFYRELNDRTRKIRNTLFKWSQTDRAINRTLFVNCKLLVFCSALHPHPKIRKNFSLEVLVLISATYKRY